MGAAAEVGGGSPPPLVSAVPCCALRLRLRAQCGSGRTDPVPSESRTIRPVRVTAASKLWTF
jgi:hypothetical protein